MVEDKSKWKELLAQAAISPELRAALQQAIQHESLSTAAIIAGFETLERSLHDLQLDGDQLSLRTLSARCFYGHAKFLDSKRALLSATLPHFDDCVSARAIMLTAYIPSKLEQIIFIENFESYRSVVEELKNSELSTTTAAVYAAGFRTAASDIRQINRAQFVTINHPQQAHVQAFLDWWFEKSFEQPACWFWGDADIEGLRLLATLQTRFDGLTSWNAAYELMQAHMQHGSWHASKLTETAISRFDLQCDYAKQSLYEIIVERQQSCDQEVLGNQEIREALTGLKSHD